MLGSHDPDAEGWCLRPGTFGAYVVTDHVDALYERLRDAGVKVLREIADQAYGSGEFSITDLEGNRWRAGAAPANASTSSGAGPGALAPYGQSGSGGSVTSRRTLAGGMSTWLYPRRTRSA
ncbi:VOC family protein [Streptomyces sp. P1-3]|uniref:VOC family protein n=1 Tax=Streptomyces sp. P1-3 TaxID=3421658 RepID=UPI003D3623E0